MISNIQSAQASSKKRLGASVLIVGAILSALLSYWASYRFYLQIETEKAQAASAYSAGTLQHTMWQHQPLLYAISIESRVLGASQGEAVMPTNAWLAELADEADLEAIYLINDQGLTLASSNYNEPSSFVGQNYGFRPYFLDAMKGELGTFFAIGVTTGLPGYFLSLPVKDSGGKIQGVIVAKLSVGKFDSLWQGELSGGFVANEDGVVILSSDPNWLYRSITPLDPQQLELIRDKKQFANQPIQSLDWELDAGFADINGEELIHSIKAIDQTDWTLHHFRSTSLASQKASLVAVVLATLLFAVVAWRQAIRSRRIKTELRDSELNRHELRQINERLGQEIKERKQAERNLEKAQTRLIQSSRMAALGQLSASVIHELGQPLSTFRNYLAAAELDPNRNDPKLVAQLSKVARRMQSTTDELRSFARPDRGPLSPVDLKQVIENSIKYTEDRIDQVSATLETELPDQEACIEGRQQRLEQIVINLICNACQALVGIDSPNIRIKLVQQSSSWLLVIADNGLGFGGQPPEQLFEAFYTTGTKGNSLGLGLAICTAIVSEHQGKIWAVENETGGASFCVELPIKELEER